MPLLLSVGDAGGLGVGKGTSVSSWLKTDMFGCSSLTRESTSPVAVFVSSSGMGEVISDLDFMALLNFAHIV